MSDSFLSQEEIDALLRQEEAGEASAKQELMAEEQDALGEIGNISMGSAATALSQLINQKVTITTPKISLTNSKILSETFNIPYLLIKINFTDGVKGDNILVMQSRDSAVIADLMMGGEGKEITDELSEFSISAVAEAMNQMMGSSATSMSTMFNQRVVISPPEITPVDFSEEVGNPFQYPEDIQLVVISFNLTIGELVDSEIMQVIPIGVAREQAEFLLGTSTGGDENTDVSSEDEGTDEYQLIEEVPKGNDEEISAPPKGMPAAEQDDEQPRNLDLILDVPLRISVVLGKTKKPIKEVLNLTPGSVVELEKISNEPVDILVNGTLIAHGEVVVINENFGVRLTHIISTRERLNNLMEA
ncbi:flagellar motor switch phosphatase FliY [Metallumcola ferriviriculae]|uniref:Flagellar motor switch phosphatase FliY n=1 Tax=Metallumcola ferriviriculae TaxID=3039180 RepID=A0AAU0UTG2_9FIRM|nr:flagellar motor switch phosphatase FliY [Desulfitibacteraceae bacterium MK1]